MKLRVLHLAHDHVSVRRLRAQLQQRPGEDHQWAVVGAVEKRSPEDGWTLDRKEALPDEVVNGQWDAIVVHRMRYPTPRWLLSMPEGPMVVWATWGDDYYRVFPALSRGIYLPATRLLLGMIGKYSVSLLDGIQRLRNALLPRQWMVTPRDLELAAMRRVDGIANMFESEFIAIPYLPKKPGYCYSSWYNAVPEHIPHIEASRDAEGPILCGTSASTTGNHLDFLWRRRRLLRSSGRRVRMVLAYGSGRYAKALRLLGKVLLNGQLEGLRKRLSLDEYYRYLAECTVVVYNQIRIESTGNVVLSFLMGHRVLMRRESHLYKRYSSMGFVVGDASARELDLSPLGDEDRRHNRELVLRSFGDEAVNARFDVFMADLLKVAGRNKT